MEKEAGAELDVTLKTSLFTGRVVVERVAASSPALGQIAAGDTLIEVMGRPPKNATHAASLLKRASALTMLVQPGKRKLGSIPVVGPEVSDLAVVGRLRWRGMLTIFFGMWLLLSVVGAPASWISWFTVPSAPSDAAAPSARLVPPRPFLLTPERSQSRLGSSPWPL